MAIVNESSYNGDIIFNDRFTHEIAIGNLSFHILLPITLFRKNI